MNCNQPSLNLTYHLRNKIISYLLSVSDVVLKNNCKDAKNLINSNDRLIKCLLELPVVENLNLNENDFNCDDVLNQLKLNNQNDDYANNLRENGQQLIQKINSIDWSSSNQSSISVIQPVSKSLKRKRANLSLPVNKFRKSNRKLNSSTNNPSNDLSSSDNLDEDVAGHSLDNNNLNNSSINDNLNNLNNLNCNLSNLSNLNNLNSNLTGDLSVNLTENTLNANPSNLDIYLTNMNKDCLNIENLENYSSSGKITLKITDIKNFIEEKAKISSPLYLYYSYDVFCFNLVLVPNNAKISKTPKNIDLFLKCSSISEDWSCSTNVELSLLNQISPNKDKSRSFEFNFSSSGNQRCGVINFITYKQLINPQNGFYVNDMIVIDAKIKLIKK